MNTKDPSDLEPVTRDPRLCKAKSVVKGPDGVPILDENGKRQYKPCRQYAIKGGTNCVAHGGRAPQVKRSARERLLEAREPALAELHRLLRKKDMSDGDKLRAITIVLDRTGMAPGVKADVAVTVQPYQEILGIVARDAGEELDPEFAERLEEYEAETLRREVTELIIRKRQLERELRQAGSIPGEVVREVPEPEAAEPLRALETRASLSGQPAPAPRFEAETLATPEEHISAAQADSTEGTRIHGGYERREGEPAPVGQRRCTCSDLSADPRCPVKGHRPPKSKDARDDLLRRSGYYRSM